MPVIGIEEYHLSQMYKTLKNDLVTVLHRSMVRSAADGSHREKRVSFESDVQESLLDLDKNNGNQLWQEAIKTDYEQFTDYQKFIVLYSGEDIQQVIRKFLFIWFLMLNLT
jgi:hypothetical protein